MKYLKDNPAGEAGYPVDPGRVKIGLEHCRDFDGICLTCPYHRMQATCIQALTEEALAYISYLEEALNHDGL